ncbi:MarR family transcriptional regulator [Streptomyces sp. NBC_00257]|uniref:MarR family winged helix-turn-helix transcriptional regulator n=1 Tax=Streptomyces TaxID=1883 RepID=UPI00224F60C9|nr:MULTISPECIES: MarR family transcriptional regulator [unclassified Streptomyces]WSW06576.1 MarR family transcriptional regulator [Streptomyces sp. NBC_01005]WTB55583.1 MarR family transcriptional regulator [Streptomyces sp. NBC_00826]WTC96080.1 MarR family transcriptional regulator [Streptomyces sp. NBC_01650]WTH91535.1 MarR family transcriptional regulator [Streptomyces sp. NBC_00825]WTI00263.1 MarR family transcriptional regulator [Streptomyces sp. NBC_00822]
MAARSQYEELARQLSAVGAVKRGLARILPAECPGGSAAVLALLRQHGEMRISRLAELLDVDMSVTSRHVAHVAERGWIERSPDPADKRSRILRLTPDGHDVLRDLNRRTTEMFAHNLSDWSDDEVGQLNTLLARLRDSFACRGPSGCGPGKHSGDCRSRHADSDNDSHTRTPV